MITMMSNKIVSLKTARLQLQKRVADFANVYFAATTSLLQEKEMADFAKVEEWMGRMQRNDVSNRTVFRKRESRLQLIPCPSTFRGLTC